MFEDLTDDILEGIGLITAKLLRINVFKQPQVKLSWSGDISEELLRAVEKSLSRTRAEEVCEKVRKK